MEDNQVTARQHTEAQLIARAQQDASFRQELVRDPKSVFARELGVTMPATIQVQVLQETPSQVYVVLPQAPASVGTELSDAELESVAGGWSAVTECEVSCNPTYCEGTCGC